MNRGELLEYLTESAKRFRKDTSNIIRNNHLTGLNENPYSKVIDAVLVAFINHVGVEQGLDYALSYKDL